MGSLGSHTCFQVTVTAKEMAREKEKARALRKSQWWQRQIAKQVCHYCQRPTAREELTMDHIVPLIRGGRSTRGNVVAACKACNNKKKYLLPVEWQEYLNGLSQHRPDEPICTPAKTEEKHDEEV